MSQPPMNQPPTTTPSPQDQIYIDVSNVYSSLQSYNTAYTQYLICTENQPVTDPHTGEILRDPSSNKFVYSSAHCTKPDPQTLLAQIGELQSSIATIVSENPHHTIDGSMNYTAQNYNTLLTLRNELDNKLQELYSLNGSIPMLYQEERDSAVYATILWTILASCLLYYLLTKRNL